MENEKIKLGQEVEDKITGFKGIAITKTKYIHQATSFDVKPKVDKDGKMVECSGVDELRLTAVGDTVLMKPIPCNDMGIKLHDKVKDTNSGFQGIAQGLAYHITGCVQVLIAPDGLDRNYKPIASRWFMAGQVNIIKPTVKKEQAATSNVGGPAPKASNSMSR